jgi:predicted nuclease of predicted toxin-antitoxin system
VSVALYMDVHVAGAVTNALRLRGVDILTAQEDGADRLPDTELLDRSGARDRVLFSQDADLLREASVR